jgi:hypothetical protein
MAYGEMRDNALRVVAVFSFGGKFSMEPGPGFFVPALGVGVYTAGNCGAKKGGVNDLQKLLCNFDLLISSGWGPGFLRRFALWL